ncbi:MAG: basic amino acid ABC transporter substrate-binding protein [Thermacetogeniaceae bacterium]
MRSIWKVLLVVMLVGLVGLLVAGCSKKQAAQPQPPQLPQYKVASEIDYPPLEFRDTSGNVTGYDIDLMNAIGKVEGFQPVYQDMNFDGIIAAVEANSVDIGLSAFTITPDRQKMVDFSMPYYRSGLILAVSKNNNGIKSIDDLKGKTIAAQIGTTGYDRAKEVPGATVKPFDHIPEALLDVKSGDAAALINDLPVSAYYVNQSPNDYKLVGDTLDSEYYGIVVAKNKPQILQQINDGLNKLKASGEFATIYKKWYGRDPEPYLPGQPPQ